MDDETTPEKVAKKLMRVVFLGPPGVGKGTLALRMKEMLGVDHISTGDMLREAVAAMTSIGLTAQKFIDQGELVPDELIIRMVEERITQPTCSKGFILDGFPRTIRQAEALDQMLADCNQHLEATICLIVDEEELVRRLGGRRTCPNCGASYHDVTNPPKLAGVCSYCGHALVVREDDKPEAIRRRLQIYREKTEPLIAYYKGKGLLCEVDASPPPDVVAEHVKKCLNRMKV